MAAIARAHDLNANLVHKWRRGVAPPAPSPTSSGAGHVAGEFIALDLGRLADAVAAVAGLVGGADRGEP